jgi:hypothetical protein
MKTIEDLQRKEKRLSFLLKIFVVLLIVIGLFLIGWVVIVVAYADELIVWKDSTLIDGSWIILSNFLIA